MPSLQLEGPPPVPADVTSQQGAAPFAGVGQQLGEQTKPGGGPQGALSAKLDAVKKVMQGVIEESKAGKTFFSRALELIDKGLQAEAGGTAGMAGGPPEPATKTEGDNRANPAFPG